MQSKVNKKFGFYFQISLMILVSVILFITLKLLKNVILTFIFYYLLFCILIPITDLIIIKKGNWGVFLALIGIKKPGSSKSIITGFSHGFILFLILLSAYVLFADKIDGDQIISVVHKWGIKGGNKSYLLLTVLVFNGLFEEIFWRGYCYYKLRNFVSRYQVILLITFFYSLYHLVTVFSLFGTISLSFIMISAIFGLGLIWGIFRHIYDNIWASLIGHTFVTIGYILVYFLIEKITA